MAKSRHFLVFSWLDTFLMYFTPFNMSSVFKKGSPIINLTKEPNLGSSLLWTYIFIMELINFSWILYIYHGSYIFIMELIYLSWSLYIHNGANIFIMELIYLPWSIYIYHGSYIFIMELIYLSWSLYIYHGAYVFIM